jgi:hypothetical protein
MKTALNIITALFSNVAPSTTRPSLLSFQKSTKKGGGLQQKAVKRLKIVDLLAKLWDYCLVIWLIYILLQVLCCLVASC